MRIEVQGKRRWWLDSERRSQGERTVRGDMHGEEYDHTSIAQKKQNKEEKSRVKQLVIEPTFGRCGFVPCICTLSFRS